MNTSVFKWKIPEYVPDPAIVCSFCKKEEVKTNLIDGPDGINICRECVSLCHEMIAAQEATERDIAVDEMHVMYVNAPDTTSVRQYLEMLYDAGYRKGATNG
ncbi:ClpX C4-type zinc finger protein [Yersinia enterocolitica]|uniref:ClpX C4-type zinc finger protein n=1 Tax=Yersinia enterocolitica TaxID=630 RepID=UPI003D7A330D